VPNHDQAAARPAHDLGIGQGEQVGAERYGDEKRGKNGEHLGPVHVPGRGRDERQGRDDGGRAADRNGLDGPEDERQDGNQDEANSEAGETVDDPGAERRRHRDEKLRVENGGEQGRRSYSAAATASAGVGSFRGRTATAARMTSAAPASRWNSVSKPQFSYKKAINGSVAARTVNPTT